METLRHTLTQLGEQHSGEKQWSTLAHDKVIYVHDQSQWTQSDVIGSTLKPTNEQVQWVQTCVGGKIRINQHDEDTIPHYRLQSQLDWIGLSIWLILRCYSMLTISSGNRVQGFSQRTVPLKMTLSRLRLKLSPESAPTDWRWVISKIWAIWTLWNHT